MVKKNKKQSPREETKYLKSSRHTQKKNNPSCQSYISDERHHTNGTGNSIHLDVGALVETVHLIKQLQQNTLHFSVCAGLRVEPLGGDSVDLVDEHHAGGVFPGQAEHVPHHAGPLPEILLYELRPHLSEYRTVQYSTPSNVIGLPAVLMMSCVLELLLYMLQAKRSFFTSPDPHTT